MVAGEHAAIHGSSTLPPSSLSSCYVISESPCESLRPRQPSTAPRLSCLGRGFSQCPKWLRGSILFLVWLGHHYRCVVSLLGGIGDLALVNHAVARVDDKRRCRQTHDGQGGNDGEDKLRALVLKQGEASEHGRRPGFLVEDWGLRSPAIPFPLAGGGALPSEQQGGPRRTSTGPGPLSCPFRDSPPSAWPLDRGRAASPLPWAPWTPWTPCCDFMPGISKSTIQRARLQGH
ncbi:hypothetical protein B0T18DRAFT_187046 [Schizothecium vesticola]|uniref:Uncharacterized protein n=1 Tax=Schizothecium vesticola TaxID=314040 RepID=A0AA40EQK5_9PEZI|nr:hypothetical protein B0T18DRAFT_187046 [Schizothecium vesticola]